MPDLALVTADEALRLVQQQPRLAMRTARRVLTGAPADVDAAKAQWATGLAARELGDLITARVEIERAVAHAEPLEDHALTVRMIVSLALVHAFDGRIDDGLALLDDAESRADLPELAHVQMQRGVVLYWQGRIDEAMAAYDDAWSSLQRSPDDVLEARLRVNMGAALSWFGRLDTAAEHLGRAAALAGSLGQTLIAASAEHNLAHVEALRGDLPAAFSAFRTAEDRYGVAEAGDQYLDQLHLDHARALLQANLLDDALLSVARVVDDHRSAAALGEAHYVAAQVAFASGDLEAATTAAVRSREMFTAAGRTSWATLADALAMSACALGPPGKAPGDAAMEAADALTRMGYRIEGLRALIVAARARERDGDLEGAEALLVRLGRRRRLMSALDRMVVAQIAAACARRRGRDDATRRHVRRGLRTFVENAAALGAIELRARAAANGEALALQGMAMAIERGRPRELLDYLEITRSTTTALQRVRPPRDVVLAQLLADLRRTAHELRDSPPGARRAGLERDRALIERRIRNHTHQVRSAGSALSARLDLRDLAGYTAVEYGELGGRLVAVSIIDGRARLHELGPADGLRDDIEACSFTLHRLNRAQASTASRRAAWLALRTVSDEVVARVLPPRARSDESPLVIVPSASLNGFAWGASPSLEGREVTIAPSLASLTVGRGGGDAERLAPPAALIAGPDLRAADREVTAIAAISPGGRVLRGPEATVSAALAALDGARVAHFACHGTFRADSPMFSTLALADGPLTVYDLEGIPRLPSTMVLSACDAGASAALQGGTLLGLASTVLTFGVRSVIAPLTAVNDEYVVWAATAIHRGLMAGKCPAGALAAAVAGAPDDGARVAAMAFVALGA